MNDPNGMVFYEGEYHLFYQYYPDDTVWGPMHWGHAVSRDLVHWEHLPIGLYPDRNGFIFSGSAVVDRKDSSGFFEGGHGLAAIFTHADTYPGTERPRQRQSLAYSRDCGRSWTMYDGNPVLAEEQYTDFRDPKVFWHAPLNHWVMVVAAGNHVRFYASPNLKEWAFTGEFGADSGSHEGVWECPDLFELPVNVEAGTRKWVLIVSIGDHPERPEGSRTQYFIGRFDGCTFVNDHDPEMVLWLDCGRDNYAGVTWSDIPEQDGRRLYIGWMSNWKYANKTPTEAWRSAMTIPRELTLRAEPEGIRVLQSPVAELKKLRENRQSWRRVVVRPDCNVLSGTRGDLLEIEAEIAFGPASHFGFKVKITDSEETVIGYDAVNRTLYVDRSRSGSTGFHPAFGCRHGVFHPAKHNRLKLHLFVDRSSVEIFADEGRTVLTDLIFPSAESSEVELFSSEGEVTLISMDIYHLQSVYHAAKPIQAYR